MSEVADLHFVASKICHAMSGLWAFIGGKVVNVEGAFDVELEEAARSVWLRCVPRKDENYKKKLRFLVKNHVFYIKLFSG